MADKSYESRRMILGENGYELIEEYEAAVPIKRVRETSTDLSRGIMGEIVWEVVPGLYMFYHQDPLAGSSYLSLVGDDRETLDEFARTLETDFGPLPLDSILNDATSEHDPDRLPHFLLQAGVGAPIEFDERFFNLLKSGMRHRDEIVRTAATRAAAYPAWVEFLPELDTIAASDNDTELRREAAEVASTIRRDRGVS